MSLVRPVLALAATAALAGCASAPPLTAGMAAAHPSATSSPVIHAPPAGDRAEAAALAAQLLSRLRLPRGARRLPPNPSPRSVVPSLWAGATAALDVHELFEVPEPMTAAAAVLAAHVPTGMSLAVTGQGGGPAGPTSAEVAYAARSFPAGVNAAQLVLTIAPDASGGSLVRADAQVIWYPPRTAAEYIDPARYHALTVAVTIFNPRVHTISKVVTSKAAIAQVADVLDRSRATPITMLFCPLIFATYRLGFAVSAHRQPVIVVTTTRNGCLGAQITVDGRKQPTLQDDGAVVAIADRLLGVTPRP